MYLIQNIAYNNNSSDSGNEEPTENDVPSDGAAPINTDMYSNVLYGLLYYTLLYWPTILYCTAPYGLLYSTVLAFGTVV